MKERLITLLAAATLTSGLAMAKIYSGAVISSSDGEPLAGATVMVKGTSVGVSTDLDGRFEIDVPDNGKFLVVNYLGMEPQELNVRTLDPAGTTVRLDEKRTALEEVVVTGMGARKKITVTGAVTNVNVEDMKHSSTSNLSNALAGNVPGIIARQTSGQPGKNKSEFWIRGISTFGAGSSAYILVDGFERESIDDLNIEDIETFTVLKDASATAIYGSKGANGVVLITTKRGKASKLNVNVKFEAQYNTRTKMPEFVDGPTYASLLNEARVTRSEGSYFSPTEIELFNNGLDPDLYPNVDWTDLLLKDGAMSYRVNANISGGGSTARYYASISYVNDEGMYKTDKTLRDRYNTNANYSRWNYRLNLDIDLTKTTLLRLGTSGDLSNRNFPGNDTDTWRNLFGFNATSSPIMYSDGRIPQSVATGDWNPWVVTTQCGYGQQWNNNVQNNISLDQDLRFLTKGLKFSARFGYDTYNTNTITRNKRPEQWRATGRDKATGELIYNGHTEAVEMGQSSYATGERRIFLDMLLNYDRSFNKVHNVGANVKFTYTSNTMTQQLSDDIKDGIAKKNVALAGQILYNFDYRYFVDFNFGYNGSENFADHHRFGFFPAVSAAWNLKREHFMDNVTWLDMFKIRYSWGKVGNDNLGDANGSQIRFPYLYTLGAIDGRQYNFGTWNTPSSDTFSKGWHYTSMASPQVTWEVAKKQDVGLDLALFNNSFSLTVDYFHEKRDGIFMQRNYLPAILGLESAPYANVGSVKSEGFDGFFRYEQRFGEVMATLRGNFTYSKSTILNYDVENSTYPYQYQTGYRVNQVRGLVAEGLFRDYDDIRNSPKQTYGSVMPGDIKYKDVNGDGIVDDNDIVAIGATSTPNLIYGVGLSVQWRGFDFNVLFQGAGKSSMLINGKAVYAFSEGRWGQVLKGLMDDRYVDAQTAALLGIPANENTNASFPRLIFNDAAQVGSGGTDSRFSWNNYRASSYWLRDISYFRLKNLEVGYSLPSNLMQRLHLSSCRFYFQGTNLCTWSSFDLWDPEIGSSNGEAYPLTRAFTLGVQINY